MSEKLLEKVGLRRSDLDKYPYEFSGGQRQRIGIAPPLSEVHPNHYVACWLTQGQGLHGGNK
ncbi:MAG: hypothetical protein V3S05_09610 [Desulfobacterales bacterium]